MKIVAVNAGPRTGWNTDTLISEAIKGAESVGVMVERVSAIAAAYLTEETIYINISAFKDLLQGVSD